MPKDIHLLANKCFYFPIFFLPLYILLSVVKYLITFFWNIEKNNVLNLIKLFSLYVLFMIVHIFSCCYLYFFPLIWIFSWYFFFVNISYGLFTLASYYFYDSLSLAISGECKPVVCMCEYFCVLVDCPHLKFFLRYFSFLTFYLIEFL